MKISLLVLMAAGLLSAQALDEWPICNNIGHTGFSPTTVLKPPFKTRWTATIPGLIAGEAGNGPVVAEGRILLQGAGNILHCLDTADGALLWRYTGPQPEWSAQLNRFYPCIASGKVYAVFAVRNDPVAAGIRCFDLNTGDTLWKRHAGFITKYCHKNSPQVSDGRVFLHSIRDVNQSTLAQANWDFKPQVQAWDAVTGDSLWTFTMWDTVSGGRTASPCSESENAALCLGGDTLFASFGSTAPGGRTVALDPDGNVLWVDSLHHLGLYASVQYTGDRLIVIDDNSMSVLNPRNGAEIYRKTVSAYSHIRISAVMNDRLWNRGCCGMGPFAEDINTGASLVSCRLFPGDGYGSGCASPRVANGFVYAGFGGPAASADFPKLYAWDEAGNPVWWFATPDRSPINHACQDVAIAYDRLYWVTNGSGQVFCFESDNRTVSSIKGICLPETLAQFGSGQIKAVLSFTDGSRDTVTSGCLFTNLDTVRASLRFEGSITGKSAGTALVRVSGYGTDAVDTLRITVSGESAGVPVGFMQDGTACNADISYWRALRLVIPSDVSGTVQAVSFRHTAASGQIRYGVYANSGNAPSVCMDSTEWLDVAPGWQKIDLKNKGFSVNNGDTLWISVRASAASGVLCYDNSGTGTHARSISNSNGSGLPTPWVSTEVAYTDYCGFAVIKPSGQTGHESGAVAVRAGARHGIEAAPNPFTRSIDIDAGNEAVEAGIFDVHGARIAAFNPADGPFTWKASDCPAGVYLVMVKMAGGKTLCKKLTLIK